MITTTCDDRLQYEIIFPVRNEEDRLEQGIVRTIRYFDEIDFRSFSITIADNNSCDSTPQIAQALAKQYEQVNYLRLSETGVGVAVRTAIKASSADIVGYMDIDLATDLNHFQEVVRIFESEPTVQFVNGSRWANGYMSSKRSLNRVLSSIGLTLFLKCMLDMKASDAICGFKFFRRRTALELIDVSDKTDNGWFFIIEMLIRAERGNVAITELPVRWEDDGQSSVNTLATTKYYLQRARALRFKLVNS